MHIMDYVHIKNAGSSSRAEDEGGSGAHPLASYTWAAHLVAAECSSLGAASLAATVVHAPRMGVASWRLPGEGG